jgi:DNA polymerase I-like protein with 3'-5' exonuclease and polymerase domains
MEARRIVAIDTEGWLDAPWGVSFSIRPNEGFVVKAVDVKGLAGVQAIIDAADDVVLHYALHDLPVMRAMGLIVPDEKIHDTMLLAYLLGLEPRGLKPLCYRHLGLEMQEYSELTREAESRVALDYLTTLIAGLPDKPKPKSKRKKGEMVDDSPHLVDLGKAKDLLSKMLLKGTEDLRKRWNTCRARQIIVDMYQLDEDMPRTTLDDVEDQAAVIQYAGADAIGTRGIFFPLMEQIDAMGLRDCYNTTVGIIPMVDRMQQIGMLVDRHHFDALGPVLQARGEELDAEIEAMIGYRINCDSGDQVAPLLFDRLQLHKKAKNLKLKRTPSGDRFTTDDKVLEALEDIHPIVPLIRSRREVTKLKGTYVDPAADWIAHDGRLHPTLKITATDTGRLAAEDPNILAFPKHSEWGRLIRYGFVAAPGHVLMSCDLDQIEMRVFAHDAIDEVMIKEFLDGLDKHSSTAALIFGRPYDELHASYKSGEGEAGEQRFAAKAVNFGVLMGITEYGLLAQFHKNGQLHWTLEDCRKLLAEWRKIYTRGAQYQSDKHAEARRFGFVRDMFGRLRWVDGVHSEDPYVRAEAERMAQATPIQSGAQGIMQRVMVALWPDLQALRREVWVEPLLQIHDDLMFELEDRPEIRERVKSLTLHHMSNTVKLRVPVTAKPAFGYSWGEL